MATDGVLIIDKPAGVTSAEVVRIVKRRVGCKTGHLGTLDPFATGVLPLCVGEGTKVAQFLSGADKEYTGIIRLGSETDTGDLTGKVVARAPVPKLACSCLGAVEERFVGELPQTPPMYSAVKRNGVPLYKLARQGLAVERAPRVVRIHKLQLAVAGDDMLAFSVACSKGTYIRVLAQDVARFIGSVGHLEALRRTRFGHFRIGDAVTLEEIDDSAVRLLGLRESLRGIREITVPHLSALKARQGFEPVLAQLDPGRARETAQLIDPDGELAAVIAADESGRWRFKRVFPSGT